MNHINPNPKNDCQMCCKPLIEKDDVIIMPSELLKRLAFLFDSNPTKVENALSGGESDWESIFKELV